MADAMYALCTNDAYHNYLAEEGLREVEQITWEKVGERIYNSYKRVLNW